jgi:phytoene desaturase
VKTKSISVIGAGFSGIAAASVLAKNGYKVDLYEKNAMPGGRARKLEADGFTFDMGPTWYWLPDVFENYFAYFDRKPSDYYTLHRLDPSYRTYFGQDDYIDLPASQQGLFDLFESIETGSAKKLKAFLEEAELKYNIGINDLVFKPGNSLFELFDWKIVKNMLKVKSLQSVSSVVRKNFKNEKLIRILEFPVIFLGAKPQNIPAIYTLMNHADMTLGTWYPDGGMYSVVDGMVQLAKELGVNLHLNADVEQIVVPNGHSTALKVNGETIQSDAVVAAADYHFVEQKLLDKRVRTYSEGYWNNRQMSPSAMLFYIGLNKPLEGLLHHNLFFDTNFEQHSSEIYDSPQWPSDPALYVSVSTKTDPTGAPKGKENLIILIPVASGLEDSEDLKEKYFNLAIERLEKISAQSIRENICFKRAYSHTEFKKDYNAFGGNAYGLANTLLQTAFLKPKLRSKKVRNLFYAGQLTTPGPGVPPSIISGMVAANELMKNT